MYNDCQKKKTSVSHHSVSIFLIDSAEIWKSNMTFLEDHPPIKRSKEFKRPVDPQDLYSPVDNVSRFCFLQFRDSLKLTPKGRANYLPHFFPGRSFWLRDLWYIIYTLGVERNCLGKMPRCQNCLQRHNHDVCDAICLLIPISYHDPPNE